jgi:hypothetical protein
MTMRKVRKVRKVRKGEEGCACVDGKTASEKQKTK